jgi:hypothetical protein
MKRQLIYAIALAFAVVVGFVLLGNYPSAQAQKPDKAQRWEYKIYKPTDVDFANNKAEGEFNKLAAEGWEFVETIVSGARAGLAEPGRVGALPGAGAIVDPPALHGITCVLFKCLKK